MVFKTAIRLQRVSKTYCQGETISGTLEVETDNQEVAHEGITIHLNGNIALLRSKTRFVNKYIASLAPFSTIFSKLRKYFALAITALEL